MLCISLPCKMHLLEQAFLWRSKVPEASAGALLHYVFSPYISTTNAVCMCRNCCLGIRAGRAP